MPFSPSSSPPPPIPSPLLVPFPLPSPPPFKPRPRPPHRPRIVHDTPKGENRCRPTSPRTAKRTLSQIPSRCRSPPPSPAVRSPPPPVPPIPAFVLTTNCSFIRPQRRLPTPHRVSAFGLYLDHPREDAPHICCELQAGSGLTPTRQYHS